MKKSIMFILVGMGTLLYAAQTNVAIQQVGVMVSAPLELETIGAFLVQNLIGYSDREKLRLVSAEEENLHLLKVNRLSAVVTCFLRKTNNHIIVDMRLVDSEGTNEIEGFAFFVATNWMKEISGVSKAMYEELRRRYPPKPVSEVRTVEVRKTYSPYEVRRHELSFGGAFGYCGRLVEGHSRWNNTGRSTKDVVVVGALDLFFLWRKGFWYVENQFHGLFPEDMSLILESQVGYGLFGGVVVPLGGVLLAYDEHYWLITNGGGGSKVFEFSTVRILPLFGLRVAFQPSFWFTISGGMLPREVPHVLFSEGMPESFVFESGFLRIQMYLRQGERGLFFLSWRMWNGGLPWREEGYSFGDPSWVVSSFRETLGSVTIGGAYVF
jgi:hypothetical protein